MSKLLEKHLPKDGTEDLKKKDDFEVWVEDMAGREWDYVYTEEQTDGDS